MSKQTESSRVGVWPSVLALAVIAGVAIAGRFLTEDLPNVAPIAAAALLAGHLVSRRFGRPVLATLVPMSAMLISDFLWFGRYETGVMLAVYGCFLAAVGMGWAMRRASWWRVGGMSVAGSVLFFVVTNFAIWLCTPYYPSTGAGLAQCYAAALPFFRGTLLGDLLFAGVMFGGYAAACSLWRAIPVLARPTLAA